MKTIEFFGTCSARSTLVLSSKRILRPFEMKRIIATFPLGCINLLALRFYVGMDPDEPASGAPQGISILAENGKVDYIVGDGTKKEMNHDLDIDSGGMFIKVYAVNDDFYDHAVDVQIEIKNK